MDAYQLLVVIKVEGICKNKAALNRVEIKVSGIMTR
jgi:hypothetical protein